MATARATSVAVIGTGHMGRGMIASLVRGGFPVRAWNRSADKIPQGEGITPCASVKDAASGASFVLTSLADDDAVRAVVFGDDGLLAAMDPAAIHLGTSTVSWQFAQELAETHARHERVYVAAPVFGRPEAAERGELWVVAGGAGNAIEWARPVLEALGQGVFEAGSAADAHLTKILGNFLIAATIEMIGEAAALAEKAGIAPAALVDILDRALLGSPVFHGYGERIAKQAFRPAAFSLALGLKDVSLALAAGHDVEVALPLASVIHDRMLEAIARGHADDDWSSIGALAREAAGLV